jgi:formylglycine-generating enzyme required for sulfatase activity
MNQHSLAVLAGCALVPTLMWTQAAAPGRAGGRARTSRTSRRENAGMIFVARRACVIGSSAEERVELGKRYGCAAAWLDDDLNRQRVELPAYWIDRYPVTNAQYLAFVEATGARRPWPGGTFPRARADHPVVGVNGREAMAYARWAGKRLPSSEEWEVAAQPAEPGLYPWGSAWPGPVPPPSRKKPPRWDLPGTRAVGTGRCGRSAAGMEDLAGQVCEWTATTMPHHGVPFHMLKGASWFHRKNPPCSIEKETTPFQRRGGIRSPKSRMLRRAKGTRPSGEKRFSHSSTKLRFDGGGVSTRGCAASYLRAT